MVVRTIEMLLEYICIIMCIHKAAKVNIKYNYWLVAIFILEGAGIWIGQMEKLPFGYKIIIFGCIFLYVKYHLKQSWGQAITIFGIMSMIILFLQLLCFYLFKIFGVKIEAVQSIGIIVNGICCIVISLWREKYIKLLLRRFSKIKQEIVIIIFVLILFRILYLCGSETVVDFEVGIQFLIETLAVGIASALWLNAENEKELKKKELQMYELYNKAFEETIMTIRIRQHEYENHINAMRSLNYTMKDSAELVLIQEQYSEEVRKGNAINRLLKLNLNPVVVGFLYSKITNAEEKGITVEFQVQPVNIIDKIEIYEFIEIVGILFDNAVEALQTNGFKVMLLNLRNEKEDSFSLEIANASRLYRNEEMEKFCINGYSSKGENRGIGLARVKEIVTKKEAQFLVRNMNRNGENFLSFVIYFDK